MLLAGLVAVVVLAVAAGLLYLFFYPEGDGGHDARPSSPGAIPLAVIGDSGSHAYQDQLAFPPGAPERGGALRPHTFNWTEIVARLRGKELDLGPWVEWGRPPMISWAREIIGLEGGRSPVKQDYLYNFANSGATCTNLMGVGLRQRFHQVPRLIQMMDRDPELWKKGVVVIKIGAADWTDVLDAQARQPDAPEVQKVINFCTEQIRDSIAAIHARHPSTHILVVGVLNDSDDPAYDDRWQSDQETANLQAASDLFAASLRKLIEKTPNTSFFDDAEWSRHHWGAHSSPHKPFHNTITIGSLAVTNSAGDDPHNSVLADHHASLGWNALWAQSVVDQLRRDFKLPLTPISDQELADFVMSTVQPTIQAAPPPAK